MRCLPGKTRGRIYMGIITTLVVGVILILLAVTLHLTVSADKVSPRAESLQTTATTTATSSSIKPEITTTIPEIQRLCRRHNGYLVRIETRAENDFIKQQCRQLGGDETWYWTSLYDEQKNGKWSWYKSGVVIFTDWAKGEPNAVGVKQCVLLWRAREYQWADENCFTDQRPICEKSLYQNP